jgi:peptidase M48-like protein
VIERRSIGRFAVIVVAVLVIGPALRGQTVSTMYDTAKVAREKARLESRINEIYVKAFRPTLTADEQRALGGVRFEAPLGGDPVLGYYSESRRRVVTLPAISLLFFEDLCTAFAWLQTRGYKLETVEEYVTMLKYKSVRAFGGRYPPPLEALGIPADATSDPRVNDLSLRFRNTGYAFILGHELGHVRFQHSGYEGVSVAQSQAHEMQADQFGLELMRRTSTIPMGAMIFFQTAVYYFENRADFPSDAAWTAYLAKRATHPLSTDRLQALSKAISASADDFARGDANRASALEIVRFIGDGFGKFAAFLNDPLLQRAMRATAEQSSPASLRPRK